MSEIGTKGLGRRALAGITWTLIGSLLSNLGRIAVVAILGRLVLPGEFGVVAVAMTVVLFATRFKELGFGLALVQRKTLEREHIATAFAMSLILGTLLTTTILVAAGPLAEAFKMPHAEGPIRALGLLFIVRSLASTSRFLCQREFKFRALAIVGVVAYFTGSGVAIVLAWLDFGAWALVLGYLVEAIVEGVLLVIARPQGTLPRIYRQALKDLFAFGGGHFAAVVANYFATQGDYIVVGRHLGDVLLGAYNRAYELMRFPAQVFTTVAGTVLFSSFARLQDDPERLAHMFRRTLFAIALVLLPASAGLVVLAPEAIRILLGSNWGEVVLPFQIMTMTMLFRTSYKSAGLVMKSAGAVLRIAAWQVVYAIMVIGGALVSVRWGIVGVSVTTGVAVLIHFLNMMRMALSQIPLTWGDVLRAHLDGVVMSVLVVVGALPVVLVLRDLAVATAVVALAGVLAGSLLPVGYAVLRLRGGSADWTWLLERVRHVRKRKKKKRSRERSPDDAQ